MDEYDVLAIIQDYIETNLFPPKRSWPKREFEYRSYGRWAAKEIYSRIFGEITHHSLLNKSRTKYPVTGDPRDLLYIIEDFKFEMDDNVELAGNNSKQRFIFSVARDTAEEIMCCFL